LIDRRAEKQHLIDTIGAKRAAVQGAAERYAERVLRPVLRWGSAPLTITPPPGGKRSILFFVRPTGFDPVVVHAFTLLKRRNVLRDALRVRDRYDIPIPRLLYSGCNWIEKLTFRYSFLATEFAPGEPLPDGTPGGPLRHALADALATLHSVRNSRWGGPGNLHRGPLKDDLARSIGRIINQLRDVQQLAPSVPEIENWFSSTLAKLSEPREFQLCHNNLAADDVHYEPKTGRVMLVDCAGMEFSRASRDLAAVHDTMFGGDDGAWDESLERYLAASPPERRREYDAEGSFFEAYFHLRKLRNNPHVADGSGNPYLSKLLTSLRPTP